MSQVISRPIAAERIRESSIERQNVLVGKLGDIRADQALADLSTGDDAMRLVSPEIKPQELVDVQNLVALDQAASVRLERKAARLESAIRGLDVQPTESDIEWVRVPENRAKVLKMLRLSKRTEWASAIAAVKRLSAENKPVQAPTLKTGT